MMLDELEETLNRLIELLTLVFHEIYSNIFVHRLSQYDSLLFVDYYSKKGSQSKNDQRHSVGS